MKFLRDVTSTFVTTMISFVFLLAGSVIIARVLQPEGKGVYTVFRTSVEFAMMIMSLGAGKALTFYVSKNEIDHNMLLGTSFLLLLAEGGAAVIGFVLLSFSIMHNTSFSDETLTLVLVSLPIPIINALNNWSMGYLRGRQSIAIINLASNLRVVSYFGVILLLVFFGWLNPGTAVIGSLVGAIIMLVVQFLNLPQDKLKLPRGVDLPVTKLLITYGFLYQLCSTLQNLHYRLDILLMARYVSDLQIGYYSLSANTAQLTWQIPQAISLVLLPFLATLSDTNASIERTAIVARFTTVCMIISTGIMALSADWLIPLIYGAAYRPAVLPLRLLLPGMITGGLSLVLGGYFLTHKKQWPFMIINGFGLALNGALNIFVLPIYGILGSAVVSSLTASLIYSANVLYLSRVCRVSATYFIILNRQDLDRIRYIVQRLMISIRMRTSKA